MSRFKIKIQWTRQKCLNVKNVLWKKMKRSSPNALLVRQDDNQYVKCVGQSRVILQRQIIYHQ